MSRAITLIRSTNPEHLEKANGLFKVVCHLLINRFEEMGITGVPGVGKSTFIEAGKYLTSTGKRLRFSR
ncbi:MAG: hypothetical protein R2790_02340 [Flavobacterium haoranii]